MYRLAIAAALGIGLWQAPATENPPDVTPPEKAQTDQDVPDQDPSAEDGVRAAEVDSQVDQPQKDRDQFRRTPPELRTRRRSGRRRGSRDPERAEDASHGERRPRDERLQFFDKDWYRLFMKPLEESGLPSEEVERISKRYKELIEELTLKQHQAQRDLFDEIGRQRGLVRDDLDRDDGEGPAKVRPPERVEELPKIPRQRGSGLGMVGEGEKKRIQEILIQLAASRTQIEQLEQRNRKLREQMVREQLHELTEREMARALAERERPNDAQADQPRGVEGDSEERRDEDVRRNVRRRDDGENDRGRRRRLLRGPQPSDFVDRFVEDSMRVRRLRDAARSLTLAGQEDLAQELGRRADRLEHDLQRRREADFALQRAEDNRRGRGPRAAPPQEILRAIRELHGQVREVRNEVRELREMLDKRLPERTKDAAAGDRDPVEF